MTPRFKEGDRIKIYGYTFTILSVTENSYELLRDGGICSISHSIRFVDKNVY